MEKSIDMMSPEASPATLNKTGVRRVNNRPLFIAMGVLVLFVLLIAMVAVNRSEGQNTAKEKPKASENSDSSTMAAEIMAGRASGIIPSSKPESVPVPELAMPVAMVANPNAPPLPREAPMPVAPDDTELSRIRLLKIQQFEEAVKAKTSIEMQNQPTVSQENRESASTPNETVEKLAALKRQMLQASDPTSLYQRRLQQIQARMGGLDSGSLQSLSQDAQLGLSGAEGQDRWALNSTVEAPRTPFELKAGSVVPGIMISGVKPELPGQIIGQVSQDVYDTATGKYLLIPQGTRLVGVYSSNVAYGQNAVLIAWQRLTFPDGKTLDIGSMPGADSAGFAGFRDQTNNHYVRIFGSALLMSGITAGVTFSQGQQAGGPYSQPTAGSVMSAALGQQLGQVSAEMIAKNLNIAPSLTIRPGYRFNITAVKDMTFSKPYQSFDYK